MKPTRNECFAKFKKAIRELMADDSEINKIKIRNLEEEKSEGEENRIEVEEMKKMI